MVPGQFKDGLVYLLCLRWRRHESQCASLRSEQERRTVNVLQKKSHIVCLFTHAHATESFTLKVWETWQNCILYNILKVYSLNDNTSIELYLNYIIL